MAVRPWDVPTLASVFVVLILAAASAAALRPSLASTTDSRRPRVQRALRPASLPPSRRTPTHIALRLSPPPSRNTRRGCVHTLLRGGSSAAPIEKIIAALAIEPAAPPQPSNAHRAPASPPPSPLPSVDAAYSVLGFRGSITRESNNRS